MSFSLVALQQVDVIIMGNTIPGNGTPIEVSASDATDYAKDEDVHAALFGGMIGIMDKRNNLVQLGDARDFMRDIAMGNLIIS